MDHTQLNGLGKHDKGDADDHVGHTRLLKRTYCERQLI